MPANVESVIATQVATSLSMTLGTNVFAGPKREATSEVSLPVVYVLATGGPPPLYSRSVGAGDVSIKTINIHVDVESAPEAYQAGRTVAYNVWDALKYLPPTGYIDLQPVESDVTYIGKNERGSHCWSFSMRAYIEE